ncbi:mucin-6 isoform X2 [Uranotaenia lowii]|uniref:mucin-6 isoform X2 n=1 Tax=Uranotaenia lowii TaxID=190385 RepID=UPI00247A7AFC|nr:mucin-6 isoform X2 [Uranotaenia lowii]
MKVWVFLILALMPLLVSAKPASTGEIIVSKSAAEPATNSANPDDIDRADRAKRSGFSLVSGLKNEEPHHFDGWGLKKSILNTLFQAVKAITGGVTVLKGQLIKGSGYAVSGIGKVIAAGGDAVSNVGKKITTSAHLVPHSSHSHAHISPFAKLSSGSAGIVSGASSSSAGLSSSSSGHHHTAPSSESFTSYEFPHDSHGPSISVPASHAYIPPKPSSHYKNALTSYGTEIESDVFPTASHFLPTPSKANVVEASDVLRQILNQKISPQMTSTGYSYHPSMGSIKYDKKKIVSQYVIPNDPFPPPFKPLKNNNNYLPPLYGLPHGPVESVTHTHSLSTSFGSPSYKSHFEADEVESSYPPSFDIYQAMSSKLAGKKETSDSHSQNPEPRFKGPLSTISTHPETSSVSRYLSPPKTTALTVSQNHLRHHEDDDDHLVHEQQLHDLSENLGPNIEVQKSLTYEFATPEEVIQLGSLEHDLNRRRSDSDVKISDSYSRSEKQTDQKQTSSTTSTKSTDTNNKT